MHKIYSTSMTYNIEPLISLNAKYSPSFNTIIIDEVQDTSQIQAHLIQALWKAPTNLIICGDPKQSIYNWRGADPSIMPNLQQSIIEQGGKLEHLQTSWRSEEALIEPINTIFSSIFSNYNQEALKPNKAYAHAHEPYRRRMPPSRLRLLTLYSNQKRSNQPRDASLSLAAFNSSFMAISDWQPTHRYQVKPTHLRTEYLPLAIFSFSCEPIQNSQPLNKPYAKKQFHIPRR